MFLYLFFSAFNFIPCALCTHELFLSLGLRAVRGYVLQKACRWLFLFFIYSLRRMLCSHCSSCFLYDAFSHDHFCGFFFILFFFCSRFLILGFLYFFFFLLFYMCQCHTPCFFNFLPLFLCVCIFVRLMVSDLNECLLCV